jgi:hypothetical protein
MPRYKFSYSIETPLRATEDVLFTHGDFTVHLGLAHPLNVEHIPASIIVEGRNWVDANAIAMEDGFGPVLDALSLHRKAPAMVQDLRSVVKAETGTLRRSILIESHKEIHPVHMDGFTIREVQSALDANQISRPALRWLRYSYRAIPVLERFVFAWLAFENRCGTTAALRSCSHCHKDLEPFPSIDRDEAFRILRSREPQLARADFETSFREWWRELRSAVLHGGRRLDTALRQRMQMAVDRFRPALEEAIHEETGFRHAFPGIRVNDGLFQTNLHHFVEFACAPTTPEFAETPAVPQFEGRNAPPETDEGVTLLDFNESKNW